jgi:hypothetical protein
MKRLALNDGGFAYIFEYWEEQIIRNALKPIIHRIAKKIQRLENDPKNFGQVDFLDQIKELEYQRRNLMVIIAEFYQPTEDT